MENNEQVINGLTGLADKVISGINESLAQAGDVIAEYGPQVLGAGIAFINMMGIIHVAIGVLLVIVACVSWSMFAKFCTRAVRAYEDRHEDDVTGIVLSVLSAFIGLGTTIGGLSMVLNPYNWLAAIDGRLGAIKLIIDKIF